MAGLQVVVVRSRDDGSIDVDDLREKCAAHRDRLAALMVTYPSTHGVFEASIREVHRAAKIGHRGVIFGSVLASFDVEDFSLGRLACLTREEIAARPKNLWRYRELFLILAWRDVAVRYKQTVIGVLWANSHGAFLLGPVLVAERGEAAGDPESAEEAARHLAGEDVQITVDLGLGKGEATVWTCDLTHGYIDINGSYRS